MKELVEVLKFYKEIGVEFIERSGKSPTDELREVTQEILHCTRCDLHQTKKNYVPGEGCINPEIMFVGEGPGETEDNFGRPFIGNAGQLLDRVIEKMGYTRETVFIANIVKCRPPGNREPNKIEADTCLPHLIRQIDILKPKVIVCLGRIALNYLLGNDYSIMAERGKVFSFRGTPMIPTYHPSYVLHQKTKETTSKAKWDMWHDMENVLALLKGKPV